MDEEKNIYKLMVFRTQQSNWMMVCGACPHAQMHKHHPQAEGLSGFGRHSRLHKAIGQY